MQFMTAGEAETKRQKAVQFLRRIGKDDSADEFEAMSPEEYAEHKGVQLLQNPQRKKVEETMARTKSKAELEAELNDANDYIEQLEGKLNDIVGIAADDDDPDDEPSDDQDEDEEEDTDTDNEEEDEDETGE